MRKRRQDTLSNTGLFHKMWRGHNREPVLEDADDKALYLQHLCDTLVDDIAESVTWYSYCLMTNHAHETGAVANNNDSFSEGISKLGHWMRNAHSRFGQHFNRRHRRQGKVAYDRPKTTELDNDEAVLTAMFYGDANPVRGGMVSHPSRYRYSSYRFYAFGEKGEATRGLTPPPAYQRLGRTAKERQKRYRQSCDRYLRNAGLIDDRPEEGAEAKPEGGGANLEQEQMGGVLDPNGARPGPVMGSPIVEPADLKSKPILTAGRRKNPSG